MSVKVVSFLKHSLFAGLLLLVSCVLERTAGTVHDTETGKPVVALKGSVTRPDGNPGVAVIVTLHSLADIRQTVPTFAKRSAAGDLKTLTNAYGEYAFSGLDTGSYFLETFSLDSMSSLQTILLVDRDSETADAVLKEMGGLSGKVDSAEVRATGADGVLLVELEKRSPLEADGRFDFGKLPAFKYSLRILAGDTVKPSSLDTIKAEVQPGVSSGVLVGSDTAAVGP